MLSGQQSRTARAAAAHRAVHQLLEQGRIFNDPLALALLGEDPLALVQEAEANPLRRPMRLFIAARTRFAEDALAAAVAKGLDQLVVLGAGLDTFACRNPWPGRLRVFEVDHPATQAWKRDRLAAAGIPLPARLTFAPVDFERETLAEGLAGAGFDRERPAFFTWLGVVPYLTDAAVFDTLDYIAGLNGGAQVVFDYSDPPDSLPPEMRKRHEQRAAAVAALGEPWLSHFDPPALHARLRALGLTEIEDLGPPDILARWFPRYDGPVSGRGGHILSAATAHATRPPDGPGPGRR